VKAISLFSGAGGLDIGCEQAGFETVAVVEANRTAVATMLANQPMWLSGLDPNAVFDEVVGLDPAELLSRAGLSRGDADLLHGGPPCTPFSKSGNWLEYKRAGADPKASLLDSYVEILGATMPKAFLMENVYGLAYRNQNRKVLDRFTKRARDAGYALDYRILLAADFGVPQLRQRLICVGMRRELIDDREWSFPWPQATHAGPHETRRGWDAGLPAHRTAAGALDGLVDCPEEAEEFVTGTYAEELRAVPPGENYLWWTAHRGHPAPRFKWRSRYWNFLLKLHPDGRGARES
jgi:DNA (cytosine-5)-methyltransferase 1